MPALIALCCAVVVFCLLYILSRVLLAGRLTERRRVSTLSRPQQLRERQQREHKRPRLPRLSKQRLAQLENELYAANIMLRADEFIVGWLCLAILCPGLAYFLGADFVVFFALVVICAVGPIVAVRLVKRQRLAKLDGQLADAISIMCGALRAGFSLQKAMETISQEMPDPIGREFGRVARECQLGMPMELSFARLIDRTRNRDLELICSAVLIQRQVGGNLAEVLDNVGETIRQRVKLKGDLKVLTASGMISGYIIGLLPVFLLLVLMLLNPEYVKIFFVTDKGRMMLLIAAALELTGFFFVRKIVSIKM